MTKSDTRKDSSGSKGREVAPRQNEDHTKHPEPGPTDDRPRWEDEMLGELLQTPFSDGGSSPPDTDVTPETKKAP